MREFCRSRRPYRVFVAVATLAALAAGNTSARLPDVAPSFSVEHIDAIHRPTGCSALLEYSNKTLVGALITDPLCLPHGVKARTIPAFPRDFHVPASKREILKIR